MLCAGARPQPDPEGGTRRVQEITTFCTINRSLQVMAERLRNPGVTRVVMEGTCGYWRKPLYLMEAHGFETLAG